MLWSRVFGRPRADPGSLPLRRAARRRARSRARGGGAPAQGAAVRCAGPSVCGPPQWAGPPITG